MLSNIFARRLAFRPSQRSFMIAVRLSSWTPSTPPYPSCIGFPLHTAPRYHLSPLKRPVRLASDAQSISLCVCVLSSHLFWTSGLWTYQSGSHMEEGHTGFLIHLPSAVLALIFLARRIQPFLSLVDREAEFCVLTILVVLHFLGIFCFILFIYFCEETIPLHLIIRRQVYASTIIKNVSKKIHFHNCHPVPSTSSYVARPSQSIAYCIQGRTPRGCGVVCTWYIYSPTVLSTCPLHTNSGCGQREAHINWSMMTCKKAAPVTGTTLRTTGPVPTDSRQ